MIYLFIDAALIVGALLLRRWHRRRRYHRSDIKYVRKVGGVRELNMIADQLDELDELLTQIDLARYHHLQGVKISLPDSVAGEHGHTLLINGHDQNTRALTELVIAERDRLRELLDTKLHRLDTLGTTREAGEMIQEVGEAAALSRRSLSSLPEISDHRYGIIKREAENE